MAQPPSQTPVSIAYSILGFKNDIISQSRTGEIISDAFENTASPSSIGIVQSEERYLCWFVNHCGSLVFQHLFPTAGDLIFNLEEMKSGVITMPVLINSPSQKTLRYQIDNANWSERLTLTEIINGPYLIISQKHQMPPPLLLISARFIIARSYPTPDKRRWFFESEAYTDCMVHSIAATIQRHPTTQEQNNIHYLGLIVTDIIAAYAKTAACQCYIMIQNKEPHLVKNVTDHAGTTRILPAIENPTKIFTNENPSFPDYPPVNQKNDMETYLDTLVQIAFTRTLIAASLLNQKQKSISIRQATRILISEQVKAKEIEAGSPIQTLILKSIIQSLENKTFEFTPKKSETFFLNNFQKLFKVEGFSILLTNEDFFSDRDEISTPHGDAIISTAFPLTNSQIIVLLRATHELIAVPLIQFLSMQPEKRHP